MKLTIEEAKRRMEQNGGSLDLRGTGIKSLPEGLTVGGFLDLEGCTGIQKKELKKAKKLRNGDYVAGRYLYADGILTHVRKCKHIDGYTLYVGKIPGKNVVFDGKHYAHCRTLRDGIADLLFKAAEDRGAEQYRDVTMDSVLTIEEAKTMYRVITGACRQGTEHFVQSLGDKVKEKYTVREMLEVTKGQYGAEKFSEFFGEG